MAPLRRLFDKDHQFSVLLLVTLATTVVLYQLLGQRLFSVGGIQSMSIQVSQFGFLALAMGLSILAAGIDLSIVAAAGLAGIMAALTMSGQFIEVTPQNQTLLLVAGVVVALVTGVLTGLVNGLIIAKLGVPPILATLGTMILYTGIAMAITAGNSVPVRVPGFPRIATSAIGPFPVVAVMLAVTFVAVAFVLARTAFGRQVFLYGENEVALRFSGVRTERVVIKTYLLIGLLVGLAAVVIVSRANAMRVGFGESYLLQAILVVVLAGFNPFGGRGRVSSLAVALVLLQLLSTSMTAFSFSPYARNLTWGVMLLLVMAVNHHVGTYRNRGPRLVAPPPPTENPVVDDDTALART